MGYQVANSERREGTRTGDWHEEETGLNFLFWRESVL